MDVAKTKSILREDIKKIREAEKCVDALEEVAYSLSGEGRDGARLKASLVTVVENLKATIGQRVKPKAHLIESSLDAVDISASAIETSDL